MTIKDGEVAEFEFEITTGDRDLDRDIFMSLGDLDGVETTQPLAKSATLIDLGMVTVHTAGNVSYGLIAYAIVAKLVDAGFTYIKINGKKTEANQSSIEASIEAGKKPNQNRRPEIQ